MIYVIPKTLLCRAKYLVLQRDIAGLNKSLLYGNKNRINQLKINVSVNKRFIQRNYPHLWGYSDWKLSVHISLFVMETKTPSKAHFSVRREYKRAYKRCLSNANMKVYTNSSLNWLCKVYSWRCSKLHHLLTSTKCAYFSHVCLSAFKV